MRSACWICLGLMAAMMLCGCKRSVPPDHTSLSLDPGTDPGPPSRKLTMNWLHHSTGRDILEGGLLEALRQDNVEFYDMYYQEGKVDGYVIGDHTDPKDFPVALTTPRYFDVIKGWELPSGRKHDVIMFKSCFPASDIKDDAELDRYKGYYNALIPAYQRHPDILFIAMSTPPLMKGNTTPDSAARARRWAKWITTEYAKGVKNVQVFDLFNALAIVEGRPDANTLAPQFGQAKYDSHPTREGARAVTRMFIPWFNRAVRASGLVR